METIHGTNSFKIESDLVSLYITEEGGHFAPVSFKLNERTVHPYALAPWMPKEVGSELPVLLKNLRGDFLCLPFGPQQQGPPHGETANGIWKKVSSSADSLNLEISASDISAKVSKNLTLRKGETAIYIEHRITGLEGNWSYGTHPILDLSSSLPGAARLSISPFRWASVYPQYFSNPADNAHQLLKIGAIFKSLEQVPAISGHTVDLTRYPLSETGDDLVMMVSEDATKDQPFAWSACVTDEYIWFSLKNPKDFPATMFWLSNGGRMAAPWDGRHDKRVGIEEVCSHFCDGVDVSRQDLLKNLGIPTTRVFSKQAPVALRNIHAVAQPPAGFGMVSSISPLGENTVKISDENGLEIITKVNWKFVIESD